MKRFNFTMGLSVDKLKNYYRGSVKNVLVRTHEGLRLQLPIDVFRPYVTCDGIQGTFVVYVDDNNKLIRIDKKD